MLAYIVCNGTQGHNGENMKNSIADIIVLITYLIVAQTAVFLLKIGSSQTHVTLISKNIILNLNINTIIGLSFYMISFMFFIIIISRFNLSYLAPIINGANYILTMLIALVILREKVSTIQLIGAGVILIGIFMVNIKGGETL
jgi:multidrug transporter EmrE-like cation transporter